MLNTRFFTIILCFLFLNSQAFAQSYKCELSENGYAHAFSAFNQRVSRKAMQEFLEDWSPRFFVINEEKLIFDGSWQLDISGGDREKNFQANYNVGTFYVKYDIKIDPFSGKGIIYLNPRGSSGNFKRTGPIRYSCNSTGGSSFKQSSVYNPFQQEFNKLTICNKKYVQQFLKGQNLYNGKIDGVRDWYRSRS